jgi:chaperonin GroEL (HSP60 family)
VRDNVAAGVLEPLMSKVKSLKSAYEAAVSILRIDDAIQCVPGEFNPLFLCVILLINFRTPPG